MNTNLIKLLFKARQGWFIAICILILLNIGLYLYYSVYLEPRLAALQRSWSEKRLQAAAGYALDNAAVYRQGTADLAAFRTRIPEKREFVAFIGELFETATNNSLRLGAISYKPEVIKGEKLLAYSIGFNVVGKYAAIKSFIADVEKFREIAVLDNISVNGKGDEESVEMRAQMTAYFRGEGQ